MARFLCWVSASLLRKRALSRSAALLCWRSQLSSWPGYICWWIVGVSNWYETQTRNVLVGYTLPWGCGGVEGCLHCIACCATHALYDASWDNFKGNTVFLWICLIFNQIFCMSDLFSYSYETTKIIAIFMMPLSPACHCASDFFLVHTTAMLPECIMHWRLPVYWYGTQTVVW